VRFHCFHLTNGIGDVDGLDMFSFSSKRLAEAAGSDQVDRCDTEAGGQDAIVGGGRTATLNVSQHADPHVFGEIRPIASPIMLPTGRPCSICFISGAV